jgi:hypothetical protein
MVGELIIIPFNKIETIQVYVKPCTDNGGFLECIPYGGTTKTTGFNTKMI